MSTSCWRRPYMSRPSSPAARRARAAFSLASRWRHISSAHPASERATTATPSSSAHTTSPGWTTCPPSTTGTFTEPGVALTVPWHDTCRLHAGKPMALSSAVSRTPASITRPRTPRAWAEVASRSPKKPCADGADTATTRMSPGWQVSIAAWIIRLSPGWHSAVTAAPEMRVPAWMGRMSGPRKPRRPMASCMVALPIGAKASTTADSARSTVRTTTGRPRSLMTAAHCCTSRRG